MWRSPSEYTATVRIPMRAAVRKMRRAISPRLATSSVVITAPPAGLRPEPVAAERGGARPGPLGPGTFDPVASQPEHPEAGGALHRGGVAGRQGHPEDCPGVPGVDHPVVDHPPGG